MTAPALRLPETGAAPAGAPSYAPAPVAEPALASAALDEEQRDLYAAPTPVAYQPAPAPVVVQPIARIVDPAAAEPQDEPLFAEPAYEERRPRGGFLSIFGGRPRYDAPQPAAAPAPRPQPSRGGALAAEAAAPVEEAHQGEDLEIPSFLRRLAN
jgi:cell division protein FtsZ